MDLKMKTRIISGIVMGVIVATVLAVGFLWNTVVITLAVASLAAGAIYELLHNAIKITDKFSLSGAMVYSFLAVFMLEIGAGPAISIVCFFALSILYFIYSAVIILKNHKDFDLAKIVSVFAVPIVYAFLFLSLGGIISGSKGIYYLLLLLNFSSVCDIGAYFSGSFLGKHKLCPEISPKKTVEGAIGGIISSLIVSVIISLCFGENVFIILALTIPFCILGMIGDLFASAIKRSVDLKDYGKLIPGHGGILDRVDSIIMIAPLMYILTLFSVI